MEMQINITVPARLGRRFRKEIAKAGRTIDGVGTVILSDFFSSWTIDERRKFYSKAPLKKTGRKVSV